MEKPCYAARIGGDEFAVLLPGIDERGAELVQENILKLVELNNQFYPGAPLCLSLGAATARPGERLEEVTKRADLRMLRAKRGYYADLDTNRRLAEEAAAAARKAG